MRTRSVAHRLGVVPAALSLALLSGAGCGSKAAECNMLVEVFNSGNRVTANLKGGDPTAFTKLADDMEAIGKRLAAVEVKTPELVKYRDDMKKFYEDYAAAARSAGEAMGSGELVKAATATSQLSDLVKRNQTLAEGINGFCQPK